MEVKLGEDSRKEEPVRCGDEASEQLGSLAWRPRGGGEQALWRIDRGS